MITNHELVRELAEKSSDKFQGWDERRGNYKETSLNRYKLVEAVVRECARLCDESPLKDGELHAKNLLEHFKVEEDQK